MLVGVMSDVEGYLDPGTFAIHAQVPAGYRWIEAGFSVNSPDIWLI